MITGARRAVEPGLETATLTWLYGHGYICLMKTIGAGKFKDQCLQLLDDVARTRSVVVITKRGRPVARLVPCPPPAKARTLAGSVLQETGDPYGTGEVWHADAS